MVSLTSKGRAAKDACHPLLAVVEKRWLAGFGKKDMSDLRESLERLVGGSPSAPAASSTTPSSLRPGYNRQERTI